MKDYFKMTVEAQSDNEKSFTVSVKVDGSCDRYMCIKALHHMLNQLESECEEDLHEALNLFLKDRGF